MIEVIFAMIVITAISAVSLQLLLAITVNRVIAKEKSEATRWIEVDLESVKFQASQYLDNSKCNASAIDVGYAQGFRDADPTINGLGGATTTLTKTINASNFRLTRTSNPRNALPYNVLEIRYRVASMTGLTIATLYTEVIPNAALRCP